MRGRANQLRAISWGATAYSAKGLPQCRSTSRWKAAVAAISDPSNRRRTSLSISRSSPVIWAITSILVVSAKNVRMPTPPPASAQLNARRNLDTCRKLRLNTTRECLGAFSIRERQSPVSSSAGRGFHLVRLETGTINFVPTIATPHPCKTNAGDF